MGVRMSRLGRWPKQFCRPVIGIVVAYAVAMQSLLIALGGFALAAHAANDAPLAFELCLHGGDEGAPALPAGAPTQAPCSHCIFCFAGGNHAVVASPTALVQSARFEIVEISWTADQRCRPCLADHSIASPRGPPPRV
jgi:hypothetical protein